MSSVRVVVACRLPGALRFMDRPREALARFSALVDRAAVLGGALTGTSFEAVAFSWDEARLEDAVLLATEAAHAPVRDLAWACGVASGELFTPGATTVDGPAPLEWGEPLAVASALARVARAQEVLVDVSVPAIVSRELLTDRIRVGRVGGARVRGFRVDARKTWRSVAAADVARMVDTPLISRNEKLARLLAVNGVITLRADSGFGGSRMLAEVAQKTQPSRSITLRPFTVVHEPLGALRRAMAFVAATERITLPPELHPALDRLLGAQGISVEDAALLIAHQIRALPGTPAPSILLDDATDLDEPSVEASGRTGSGAPIAAGLQPLIRVKEITPSQNVVVMSAGASDQFAGPLPGANRPAFSYLVLGAMRGWAGTQNGTVTATDSVNYARKVLNMMPIGRTQEPMIAGVIPNMALSHHATEQGPDLHRMLVGPDQTPAQTTPDSSDPEPAPQSAPTQRRPASQPAPSAYPVYRPPPATAAAGTEGPNPWRTVLVYGAVGFGLGAVGFGTVAAAQAKTAIGDCNSDSGTCSTSYTNDRQKAITSAVIADVALGLGVAALIGAYLLPAKVHVGAAPVPGGFVAGAQKSF